MLLVLPRKIVFVYSSGKAAMKKKKTDWGLELNENFQFHFMLLRQVDYFLSTS